MKIFQRTNLWFPCISYNTTEWAVAEMLEGMYFRYCPLCSVITSLLCVAWAYQKHCPCKRNAAALRCPASWPLRHTLRTGHYCVSKHMQGVFQGLWRKKRSQRRALRQNQRRRGSVFPFLGRRRRHCLLLQGFHYGRR